MKKIVLLLVAILALVSMASCNKADVVYKVGTNAEYPPFESVDDAGNPIHGKKWNSMLAQILQECHSSHAEHQQHARNHQNPHCRHPAYEVIWIVHVLRE